MAKIVSVTEARGQLMKLSDEMAQAQDAEAVTITKYGRPVMVLLPYEAYESLLETLAILSDPRDDGGTSPWYSRHQRGPRAGSGRRSCRAWLVSCAAVLATE